VIESTTVPFVASTPEVPVTSVVTIQQQTSPAGFTEAGSTTSAAGSAFTGAAVINPTPFGAELFVLMAFAAGQILL
jgi:hypothetical protein